MAVLCIDVGTSVIKAVAFDDRGEELALARREAEVLRPRPGWAEQDMDAVWEAVAATARDVTVTAGDVRLVAVTAQGDGCWLVDAGGRPTGPAILWNDARATPVVDAWRGDGTLDAAFAINGSMGFAGLPHAILAWLRERDPGRIARSRAALTCGGWIFLRLTGEIAIDESDASAPFMDIRARRWSEELLELYGLAWARSLLPAVRGDDGRTAPLGADAAAALGLRGGVPVVLAPYDVAAAAIGAGAVAPGQACAILGTTLCTGVVVERPADEDVAGGLTLATAEGRWLRAFPTLAGGEVIAWAVRTLGLSGPAELSALAATVPAGADGLQLLPYLSPAGERAPFLAPEARGALVGLSFDHGRAHVCRAVLDGLTLVVRDCLQASTPAPEELRACGLSGGGAESELWCRLIADATGVPAFRTRDREVGAKGAMLVALVATGTEPDLAAAAARMVRRRDAFEPDAGAHGRYDELYARFLELRELAAPQWRLLAGAASEVVR